MGSRRIPAEQTPRARVPKKVSGTYPRPKPIGIPDRPSDVGLAPKLPPTQEKPAANTYGVPSDALPYIGPQLSLIQSQEDARRQALGEYTKAVLAELGKFAPQIGSDYDTAIGQSRSLAQAGSDSLRQANGNTDIQSILQAANAPAAQQQQVATNLGNVFNGGAAALFGQQGVFPGQQLIRDKAASQAFANDLPGINALAGTAALKNLLYQSGVDRQKVLGQIPSILSDIAKQKADAGYRQATLAQGQQRIDLSAKNEKRQLANDAFGQWAKTVSLKQGNQRLSMQSAQQQFNQWAKQQGIDARWAQVDISQRRLALQQNKPPKARFTPQQTQAYKATAAHMAKATFWGIKDKNGVNHPPLSYQDAISELQGEGVPLAIAQQALNRYWKRPGYEVDVQSRVDANGDFGKIVWDRATAGRGRPLKSYQQRHPGKAGAAAETAALDTTQQTALAGQALSMIDPKLVTPDNVRALVSRIQQESGGNPAAVNNWDSNAKAGHPSKGILQTIDSTFNAYAVPGHNDIWNPLDNALAAVRYMLSRYGHIVAANGRGY